MQTKLIVEFNFEFIIVFWIYHRTDSLRTRRVRRMNWSLICLRRRLGRLSLGMTKRSRWGTFSPISCISPSTTHHSDFPSLPPPLPGSFNGTLPLEELGRAHHRSCWWSWCSTGGSTRRVNNRSMTVCSLSLCRCELGGWQSSRRIQGSFPRSTPFIREFLDGNNIFPSEPT